MTDEPTNKNTDGGLPPDDTSGDIEIGIAGLVLDPVSNAPIVLLKTFDGELCLPIWIGLAEAGAIASALKDVPTPRPMTHDLLKTVLDELGGEVSRVRVRGLEGNTFLAHIELKVGGEIRYIDARPSDALALAVRTSAKIFVHPEVLSRAQVTLEIVPGEGGGENGEGLSEQGDSNFATIGKEQWAELLAGMDPDDFKYKM